MTSESASSTVGAAWRGALNPGEIFSGLQAIGLLAALFMDKKLSLKLNGGRQVQGILRGFDPFMNLVMDECLEMAAGGQQNTIGMVVIRGNSIIMLEALERV
ncbi:UNVERIFIED_CONTAM: hypothetical protein FKN15_059337 [Acipenser sinensis]